MEDSNSKKNTVLIAVAAVLVASVGVDIYADSVAEEKVDQFIAEKGLNITYDGVEANIVGSGITLEEVRIDDSLYIESVSINGYDSSLGNLQTELEFAIEGAEIPSEELPRDYRRMYDQLGFDSPVKLNATAAYHYDESNRTLFLDELSASADDVGGVSLSFAVADMDFSEAGLSSLLFTWQQLKLAEAEVVFDNDELMERTYELIGREQGISADEAKDALIAQVKSQGNPQTDFQEDAFEELIDFIDSPGELSIEVSPKEPVSFGQLMRINRPAEMVELLQLEVDG
ncbi:hypothetical protein [Ferrimonas aestuarii]|uniref:DUF945 domain-containing protein n=1 Tax=Ferrimonas aestuarii TaxID=2569539 RepID=A0A4V5NZX5_9GAMM|nr:hypothetical protein [Ferrimonas aestuarii]TKB58658.1 hypothetical protein FCL42_02610 [Ferrimonas aestuarii]